MGWGLIALTMVMLSSAATHAQDMTRAHQRAVRGSVIIFAHDMAREDGDTAISTGSGWITVVGDKRVVITNRHVVSRRDELPKLIFIVVWLDSQRRVGSAIAEVSYRSPGRTSPCLWQEMDTSLGARRSCVAQTLLAEGRAWSSAAIPAT